MHAQSCLTLCDPMDCNMSGSSVHGIFQARILEQVAISYTKLHQGIFQTQGLNQHLLCITCIACGFFTTKPPGKPHKELLNLINKKANQLKIDKRLEQISQQKDTDGLYLNKYQLKMNTRSKCKMQNHKNPRR